MPDTLMRREAQHRQRVLLGLATLLVLSISPVVGHHVVHAVSWLPASVEHFGPFCVIALHRLLAPVHGLFHILLFVGLAFAAVERSGAAWRHAKIMRALPIESATSDTRLVTAIGRVGFAVDRVRVVAGLPNPAFTSGWISPRVYVAKSLPDLLNADELEAVLAHEIAHVRRRDPLRLFALRSLAATLFWLPAIRKLVDDLADEAEIVADDFAAQRYSLPLAAAILRMAGADVGPLEAAVGFQRTDLLERRIRRLAGEEAMVRSHVSTRSILAAALALTAVWTSGVIVLHPLPEHEPVHSGAHHCVHLGESALSHLFCLGRHQADEPCPHVSTANGMRRSGPGIPTDPLGRTLLRS